MSGLLLCVELQHVHTSNTQHTSNMRNTWNTTFCSIYLGTTRQGLYQQKCYIFLVCSLNSPFTQAWCLVCSHYLSSGPFIVTDPFSSHLDYLLSEQDVAALQEQPQNECKTAQVRCVCVCVCARALCVCFIELNSTSQMCSATFSHFTLTLSDT